MLRIPLPVAPRMDALCMAFSFDWICGHKRLESRRSCRKMRRLAKSHKPLLLSSVRSSIPLPIHRLLFFLLKISTITYINTAKALELFLAHLVKSSSDITVERGSRKVESYHLYVLCRLCPVGCSGAHHILFSSSLLFHSCLSPFLPPSTNHDMRPQKARSGND